MEIKEIVKNLHASLNDTPAGRYRITFNTAGHEYTHFTNNSAEYDEVLDARYDLLDDAGCPDDVNTDYIYVIVHNCTRITDDGERVYFDVKKDKEVELLS